MLHKRTIHGGRTEFFDPETDEVLACYAPGDGRLRFVWRDAKRNDTGRTFTVEEAQQLTPPDWKLENDGKPYLQPFNPRDEHRASLD